MNFTIFAISLLLFLITAAGAMSQWPIGYLSDQFDRRIIIILCTISGAIFSVLIFFVSKDSLELMFLATEWGTSKLMFFIFITIYAGAALPLFPLNITPNLFVSQSCRIVGF